MKISFEIWDTTEQKWVWIGDGGIRYVLDPQGTVFDIKWSEFKHNFTPVLCTGIKDCKGTMIFEGDILEFDSKEWGDSDNKFTMRWDDAEGCWTIGGGCRNDISTWCTVVDNIYGKRRKLWTDEYEEDDD